MEKTPDTQFHHGRESAAGVLLINLGTPEQPTPQAVRRYLREFLNDRRVVELPRALWWPILHGLVLRTRPRRVARSYRAIWGEDGAPLRAISLRQRQALGERLSESCRGPVEVALGMRYGSPSIATALQQLRRAAARKLLVLPLYPQYAAATTASGFDAVAAALREWRWLPELRLITHYHDHPGYIAALAASIERVWAQDGRGQKLLFSFHGVPKATLLAGDPYHCECQKTARLVAERLRLRADDWEVSFQSRFGRAEWLQPYTSERLQRWAADGVAEVDVICPGFAADCLETLEEIQVENRDLYRAAGGARLRYIPALNEDPAHIELLAELVMSHGRGWPQLAPLVDGARSYPEDLSSETPSARRARALAAGAER